MIGYERGVLQRLGHSPARLGRGFPHDCMKDITTWAREHFVKVFLSDRAHLLMTAFGFYLRFASHIHVEKTNSSYDKLRLSRTAGKKKKVGIGSKSYRLLQDFSHTAF